VLATTLLHLCMHAAPAELEVWQAWHGLARPLARQQLLEPPLDHPQPFIRHELFSCLLQFQCLGQTTAGTQSWAAALHSSPVSCNLHQVVVPCQGQIHDKKQNCL